MVTRGEIEGGINLELKFNIYELLYKMDERGHYHIAQGTIFNIL